ncbi:hypothetical protein CNR22_16765 [Sphingobacteriaceae bacterium]|nr:hypothetical protein CNR22_16765 [Sphingobacteriaceae bacterium]
MIEIEQKNKQINIYPNKNNKQIMKNKLLLTGIVALSFFFSHKSQAQVPTASFSLSQPSVCAGGTLHLTDASSETPTAWSYTIEGPATLNSTSQNPTFTLATVGDYTVILVATNANGSSSPATGTISVKALPVVTASAPMEACAGSSVTFSGGGASTYAWTDGVSDGVAFAASTSKQYTVTGTDIQGCKAETTVSLTVHPLPVLTMSGASSVCIGSAVTLTVAGASSYTWNSGETVDNISATPATNTTFIASGTDAITSCSNSVSQSITVNALPVVTVNSASICSGDLFTMVPAGAASYVYSNGSNTVTPLTSDSYTVTGTDANGCVNTAVSNVTLLALPVISVSGGTLCSGSVFTLTPTGAATYSINSVLGTTVNPAITTSYSITGTDANGCKTAAAAIAEITVSASPALSVNSGSVCAGQVFTITPTSANTVTFSFVTGASTVAPLTSTNYIVAAEDANGCRTEATSVLTVVALPVVTVNSASICTGDVFTMVPAGAASYVYSNGSNTVSPLTNDSYTVTGTDANGCVNTAVSNVTLLALPVISVSGGTLCSGSVFTLTPTGAATYSINSVLGTTVNPAITTSYSITGTDANGCKTAAAAIAEITVSASPALSVNSGSICAGQVFTITPTSANTVTFSFVTGASTVAPSTSTNYIVAAEDANGCRTEATSVLTVVALPVVSVNSGSICSGSSFTMTPSGATTYTFVNGSNVVNPTTNTSYSVNGSSVEGCVSAGFAVSDVTVNALPVVSANSGSVCLGSAFLITASGASTYTFEGGSSSVTPLATTNYTVVGTSAQGCTSSNIATVTVNVWSLPVITITSPTAICSGQTTTLNVSGNASTYTWVVSNSNATSYPVNPTTNTTYTVIGTDGNGCEKSATRSIVVNSLPTITVNSGIICSGGSFTIVPTGALTYSIQNNSTVVSPAATTAYTVIGVDANGCVSALPAVSTVSVVNSLTINVTGNTTICNGQSTSLTASGATTYSWNATTLTNTISVNPSTTTNYVVTGSASGCSQTKTVTVVVNALPVVTVTSSSALICVGETATLTSTGALTYSWDNNSTLASLVVTPTVNTTYTVTGTDVNTCSAKTTFVQNVSECTGIAKADANMVSAGIYPNPTNGDFTVTLTKETAVKILNGIGQVVFASQLASGDTTVSLNGQPNGIYFVQLKQGNQFKTVKVVKN